MRVLLTILLVVVGFIAKAQTRPVIFPSPNAPQGYYKIGWIQADSGLIAAKRDTIGFLPRFSGTIVMRPQNRNLYMYDSVALAWKRILFEGDIVATAWGDITGLLSNQTDLYDTLNNRFKQNGNVFSDTARLGTNNNFPLVFKLNNVQKGIITQNGWLGLGTLTPFANLDIRDSTSDVVANLVPGTSNTSLLRFYGLDGRIQFLSNQARIITSQKDFWFDQPSIMTTSGSYTWMRFYNTNQIQASGDGVGLFSDQLFHPSSGTATHTSVLIGGGIDQTGGANGATYGLRISQSLVSAPNYTAFRIDTGNISTGKQVLPLVGAISTEYVVLYDSVSQKWRKILATNLPGGGGGGGITQLTGDGTAGPGSGSQVFTLAATGVSPGTYTNTTLTVDAKGRITAASSGVGGGGTNNSNIGSGFRWLSDPTTQTLRTVFSDVTGAWDSTSNSGALTYKVDTTFLKGVYLPLTLNSEKTINQTGNNIYFTGGGQLKSDSINLTPVVLFAPPDSISAYGNSITVGLNSTNADSAWINRVGASYNLTVFNHAVSGRGIWQAAQYHNLNINPGHHALSSIMAGFNDVRRGGVGYKTVRKIIGGHNAIIANHFLKSWTPGGLSSTSIVRYGTWLNGYLSSTVGGKSNGNGTFTSTLNDSIVYTATDSTFVIGLIGADSTSGVNYNYSAFEVYVDGSLYGNFSEGNMTDGISDGSNDNGRSPFALMIRGLSYASHRIKLVNKSASGAFFVVDYFGHLIDKINARPIFILNAPKMDATGYAISPNQASDAVINSINASLDSLVATWAPYPIYSIPTNSYYIATTASGLDADHIHPNDLGHRQIWSAVMATRPQVTTPASDGTIMFGTSFFGKVGGRLKQFAFAEDVLALSDTSRFIINNPSSQQPASFNINGVGRVGGSMFVGSNVSTSSSLPGLRIYTGGTSMLNVYKFGTENFLFSADTTSTTGVTLNIPAGIVKIGSLSGGVNTVFGTFDNANTNKFVLTGNALFNSVRLGTAVAIGDAAFTAGTIFALPGFGLFKSNAGTDNKKWNVRMDDTTFNLLAVNDAENASNYAIRAKRTGTTVDYVSVVGPEFRIGSNADMGAYTLQNTGGNYQNGPFYLAGQNTGTNTMKLLVKGNDSLVYNLDPSALIPSLSNTQIGVGNGSNQLSGSSAFIYDGTIFKQENSAAKEYIVNTDALSSTSGGLLGMYNTGTPSASSQVLGAVEFGARISGNYRKGAGILAVSSGAWTDPTNFRTDLIVQVTASGQAVPGTAMRINGGGRTYFGANTVATATVEIVGGSTSVAPLGLTLGSDLSSPTAGKFSYATVSSVDRLAFVSTGTTYKRFPLMNDVTPTAGGLLRGNGTDFTLLSMGTAGQEIRVNAGGTDIEWYTPSAGGNTIYTGDGTLSGNRIVTGSSNSLTFASINAFRVNSNITYFAKSDGSYPYELLINASPFQLFLRSKTGNPALIVDTLSNIMIGPGNIPSTHPLYAGGGTAAALNGFTVGNGYFETFGTISTNTTLSIQYVNAYVDASVGNVTITLPTAASTSSASGIGWVVNIKRVDASANTVTIQVAGGSGDTIDGSSSITLASMEAKKIQSVGSNKFYIK